MLNVQSILVYFLPFIIITFYNSYIFTFLLFCQLHYEVTFLAGGVDTLDDEHLIL